MLILSRAVGEEIKIFNPSKPGAEITITMLGIDRQGSARIGIAAPNDVKILRGELDRRKDKPIDDDAGNRRPD